MATSDTSIEFNNMAAEFSLETDPGGNVDSTQRERERERERYRERERERERETGDRDFHHQHIRSV